MGVSKSKEKEQIRASQPTSFIKSMKEIYQTTRIFKACLAFAFINLSLSFLASCTPLYSKYALQIQDEIEFMNSFSISIETQNTLLQVNSVLNSHKILLTKDRYYLL
jgi:hypothetical protein